MEETCAIANHEGIYGNPKLQWTQIVKRYPLTQILESAHSISTLVIEPNIDAVEEVEIEETEETNE